MKKNRIIFFILLFLSYVFVFFFGGKVPYTIFFTLLSAMLFSLAYCLIVYSRFKYTQEISKRIVVKGDTVDYSFLVSNEDFFIYPYVTMNFFADDNIFAKSYESNCFSLLPKKSKTVSFTLDCKYRGIYEVGIKSIYIEDPLGLFKIRYKVGDTKMLRVYPRIVPLKYISLVENEFSETHSHLNTGMEDMTVISDLREYHYGDSFKRIHWKASARMRTLMVKNFQATSQSVTTLMLDLKNPSSDQLVGISMEDLEIEAFISCSSLIIQRGIPFNVMWFDNMLENAPIHSQEDFELLYDFSSEVQFKQQQPFSDILKMYCTDTSKMNDMFIFSLNLDYEMFNTLYSFSANRISITYVYIYDGNMPLSDSVKQIIDNLRDMGIKIYAIPHNGKVDMIGGSSND